MKNLNTPLLFFTIFAAAFAVEVADELPLQKLTLPIHTPEDDTIDPVNPPVVLIPVEEPPISLECDMACAIELSDPKGQSHLATVIANCGDTKVNEGGFSFNRAGQPTGCNCRIEAYSQPNYGGKMKVYSLPSGSDVRLCGLFKSAVLICTA